MKIEDFTDIKYVKEENGICTATLSRPEKRNAVNGITWLELQTILKDMEQDKNARVLILTGDPEGRAFTSGGYFDPKAMVNVKPEIRAELDPNDVAGINVAKKLFNFSKPVIAAINGLAIGGGITMPLIGADLIYMAESAWLGFYFVKRALLQEFSLSFLLPLYVGFQRAKEIIYFGDKITSKQALEYGLVNKVLPDDELISFTREQALRLIPPKGPSLSIKMMKKTMHSYFKPIIEATLNLENEGWKKLLKTQDFVESLKSLKERRDSAFKGE
ncbi:MAG: enoyl-CoA hydratase/isomerase family protein [Promethearchaeota archaeon]